MVYTHGHSFRKGVGAEVPIAPFPLDLPLSVYSIAHLL